MVGVGGRTHVKRCECCRKRKVKCDGQKPACQRCLDHGLRCTGYERKLEFIHFEGQGKSNSEGSGKGMSAFRNGKRQSNNSKQIRSKSGFSDTEPRPRTFLLAPASSILTQSLAIPQNKLGLMTVLHARYVPEYHDASNKGGICASWITTACNLISRSEDSEMLSNSLLAMSLSIIGPERQQENLSMSRLQYYSKALNGLLKRLASGPSGLNDHQVDVSLVTCLACGMYEVMANHSYAASLRHLDGIAALLTVRGVENITTSTSRRTFYEYRCIKLSVDLATRRACFLSLTEWINPPWKASELHSASYLQTVSDIVFRIPPAMEQLDQIRNLLQPDVPLTSGDIDALHGIILEAFSIHSALEKWAHRFSYHDRKCNFYTPRPARAIETSAVDDEGKVYLTSYDFPNWDCAASFVYYSMSYIYINSLLIDMDRLAQPSLSQTQIVLPQVNTRELTDQSIECADRICESIEYFLEDNKRLVGRMVVLAPFETAKSFFKQLDGSVTGDLGNDSSLFEKAKFCETIAQRIRDSGLPVS